MGIPHPPSSEVSLIFAPPENLSLRPEIHPSLASLLVLVPSARLLGSDAAQSGADSDRSQGEAGSCSPYSAVPEVPGIKPSGAFVEASCWKTESWRSGVRGQRPPRRPVQCSFLPYKSGCFSGSLHGALLSPGLGGASGTGSQARPGGWDSGWPGPEPGMRRDPALAWPQDHRRTGHPPNRKPCPAPPLSHPVFPAGGAFTVSRGSCCQESCPLEKGSWTSGSQAALPLTYSSPLPGPPVGGSSGSTPIPQPHMLVTYLLLDDQSPLGAWQEKPHSRARPGSPETGFFFCLGSITSLLVPVG